MLATQGRRSDVERNAFWASVVSLMPADLIENRQGRAMMRILGIPYRTVKRANAMRKELEDTGKGWVLMQTKQHSDSSAKHIQIVETWWHSDEASSADNNQGKERVRVYRGHGIDPATGRRGYELHEPRAQEGNDKHALSLWHKSDAAKRFQKATATPKRPEGIKVGVKLLVECRCKCIKKRHATFADCKICSFVTEGLKNWHKHRSGWRQAKPGCSCHLCSDPQKAELYRGFSRSVRDMKRALLPCGLAAYPNYSIGDAVFTSYPGLCSHGKCPKQKFGQRSPDACGWEHVFGHDCPVESSDDLMDWWRWEPKLRSENAEGKKFYSDEWVPHRGTRAEFLRELRTAIKDSYLSHDWRHLLIRHAIKLHESRKDGLTGTEWSDYAAVLDLTRGKTVTCGVPERINELVTVMGYKPYEQTVELPKSRRHPARTVQVRKQHVDVYFAFHPTGYKSDARSYNVAQEDIDSFLKTGKVRHGEWFHVCQRLPGGDHSKPLPEGFSERPEVPPDFPEYERKLSVTDGCAGQFDGKDNYHQERFSPSPLHINASPCSPPCIAQPHRSPSHTPTMCLQTAEWFTKFGILRIHWVLEAMEGKSICDALGNLPKNAIIDAIQKGEYIFAGSREFVLFLAAKSPKPSVCKAKKDGWWAVDRIFYGFFEHAKFTKLVVPTADGFHGSHDMHMIAGTCRDANEATKNGRLEARAVPSACPPCTQLRFKDCEMSELLACKVKAVKAPRADTETAGLRQMESLHLWAASLKKKQLVATRVAKDEQSIEGIYWLAVLLGKPFEATEATLSATDSIEPGFLVVKAQWLKLESKSCEGGLRSYTLLDAEVLLVVNHLVRLSGLQFAASKGGPQGRSLRNTEAGPQLVYISRDTHHSIEACCD